MKYMLDIMGMANNEFKGRLFPLTKGIQAGAYQGPHRSDIGKEYQEGDFLGLP